MAAPALGDLRRQLEAAPFLAGAAPGALDILAAVVSKWSGTRAHMVANRPAFSALLDRIEAHPSVAPVIQAHWPARARREADVVPAVRRRLRLRPRALAARVGAAGRALLCYCRWCQRETGSAFALNAMIESDRAVCLE